MVSRYGLKTFKALFFAILLAPCATALPFGASAQVVQPPVISAVDNNGVNLTDGSFQLPNLDVGIGGGGSGISRRTQADADNFSDMIKVEGVMPYLYMNVSYDGTIYRFHVGNIPNGTLTYLEGPYKTFGGPKGTLSCTGSYTNLYTGGICTLTLDDGTHADYYNSNYFGNWGGAQTIVKADGEVLNLNYYFNNSGQAKAVKSVSSSLGWMLKYEVDTNFKVTKVSAVNTSAVYCDPAATSCASAPATSPAVATTTSGATSTLAKNGTAVLSYTVSGNTTTIQSPSGITKTITKIASGTYAGRVYQVTSGASVWTYAYVADGSNNVTTTVTQPNGASYSLISTPNHQISSQTDELGRTTRYTYDANGHLARTILPDATYSGATLTGGYNEYTYDANGNVTASSSVPRTGGTAIVSTQTYPTGCTDTKLCNKPVSATDANGVVTTYTYDVGDSTNPGSYNIATTTSPAVTIAGVGTFTPQTRYSYSKITPYVRDASNALVAQPPVWRLTQTATCMSGNFPACIGTSDEFVSIISYGTDNTHPVYNNALPVSQTVKRGDGTLSQTITFTYDSNGNIITADGPKTGAIDTSYYLYDALNRQIAVIGLDPDGASARLRQASRTLYNSDGRAYEVDTGTVTGTDLTALNAMTIQARDVTEYSSTTGVKVASKQYLGSATTPQKVTQYSYDSVFNLDCIATRLNPADYASLPSSACTLGTTLADGSKDRIVKYTYNATSTLLSSISAYGTSDARTNFTNTYSATNGKLTSVADAKGNLTSYSYDNFGRVNKICYPQAANGAVSSTTDCQQTTYMTTSVTGAALPGTLVSAVTLRDGTSTVNFDYDVLGRLSSKTGAVSETFTYNNFDQTVSHVNNTTGGATATETYAYNSMGWLMSDAQPVGTVTYDYDSYGKRSKMTYPDGFFVTYTYDEGDELTGIYDNAGASLATFTFDNYSRQTALNRGSGKNDSYVYDTALRLQTMSVVATGGSNTITYGYNNADELNSRSHSNTAYETPTPSSVTTTYAIDGLNRVTASNSTAVTYDNRGNTASVGSTAYTYNANNMLVTATGSIALTYDANNRLLSYTAGGATTKFLYDGANLIAEYSSTGTVLRKYVHSLQENNPLVWYEGTGTGTKRYFIADERGSIIGTTDSAGNILAINSYDAYGVPSTTSVANAGRFRYTGQVWLEELSLYNYKARMYAPTLGRFFQPDPIGYGDGMNWYNYVHSDPVNGVDPSGLDQCPAGQNCGPIIVVGQRCASGATCMSGDQVWAACGSYGFLCGGGNIGGFYMPLGFGYNPTYPTQASPAPAPTKASADKPNDKADCNLVAPSGEYHTNDADARFSPEFEPFVSAMIKYLNSLGIVPTITSGFRSYDTQKQLYDAYVARGKTGTPAADPDTGSNHMAGEAVDFGPESNVGNSSALSDAGSNAGLRNKIQGDDMHFSQPGVGGKEKSPDKDRLGACKDTKQQNTTK